MRSMQRVVAILESVSRSATPATPGRVSEETSLSLSTVSRIMRELAVEEMLDRSSDGTYVLGTRVFNLVSTATSRGDRTAGINRVLQHLRDLTGETASLHVRRGDQRVCVASATSGHSLRRVIPIGDSVNLVGSVPGDVFLSQADESERDSLVSAVLSGRARKEQLEKIRFTAEHGYSAYSADSHGLTGIAVPVRVGDEVHAALAVSGPSVRFTVEIAESWLPDLRTAARRLEPWMRAE
ncbi:helix-turn-helix domain-containing protein [Actinomadura sp. LD22]|uniref:Helix-turn-helix domain-containing protein n=1 Tax=Actinomadura physcomitrii TaxID=2650748 RepID=A0A6I4MAJ6_9ACTN|nr:IclR family transcriptional regulator C-terminal domain-containing protein [Actinomadura physcomitrii]MWA03268.1 helix-turn-helix domain-containing protein [Actinomadura physcomitrii]